MRYTLHTSFVFLSFYFHKTTKQMKSRSQIQRELSLENTRIKNGILFCLLISEISFDC